MPEPIGEEFIRIRPDTTGFRAELQKQLSSVTTNVSQQAAGGAQARLLASATATKSGLLVVQRQASDTAKAVTQAASAVSTGQAKTAKSVTTAGKATKATNAELALLSNRNRAATSTTQQLAGQLHVSERGIARYTRGVVAANASTLGFASALTFASGAFLVGAAAGSAIATGLQEFAQSVKVQAQTAALIKATGGAANVTAGQVNTLSGKLLDLTGVDDEIIKQGANVLLTFRGIRNEVGQGNDVFNRATKAALDTSTVFGTDLRSTAVQLGKALQDPAKGLTALRRSGITFSADQQRLIKSLVATGQVLTAQKFILAGVEQQVGGTAAAIGRTLPGRLNILKERARNTLGEYVKRVSESQQATELAAASARTLGSVWAALQGVAKTLGPPLISIVQGGLKLTEAVGGAGTVLAAVAAYKAASIAIALATGAQAAYTRAVLVGTGAIEAENAALLRQAGIARVSAASLAGTTVGRGASAVTIGALGTRTGAAAAAVGGLRLAVSSLGGPLGIAAIGAGALALAFLRMRRNADAAAGSVKGVRDALSALSQNVTAAQKIADALAQASEARSIARLNVIAAQRGLTSAQGAAARSTADPGSVEQQGLAANLTQSQQALAKASRELAAAEAAVRVEEEKARRVRAEQANAVAKTANDLRGQLIPQLKRLTDQQKALDAAATTANVHARLADFQIGNRRAQALAKGLGQLRKTFADLADSGDTVERKVGGALLAVLDKTGRLPKRQQIDLVLNLTAQGASLDTIFNRLGILSRGIRRQPEGRAFATPGAQDIVTAQEARRAAQAELEIARKQLQVRVDIRRERFEDLQNAKEEVRTARDNVAAAKEAAAQARQALTDARQAAAEARQSLADTIAAAREQINQAVTDAKANLDTLGQAIAGSFQKFADAAGTALGTGGALGKRFRELRDQVVGGQGGPGTQRAAQQIAFEIQSKRGNAGVDFERQFADLTDSLNRGKITLPQFTRQFNALIKSVDINAFRKQFGTAAANTLVDEINAARRQAGLIAGGPRRAGGGTVQTLVKPLQAVAQAGRDIAAARRDVIRADRGIVDAQKQIAKSNADVIDAERALRKAQNKKIEANTLALRALQRATQANTRVIAAQNAKDRAQGGGSGKGKGAASRKADEAVNTG